MREFHRYSIGQYGRLMDRGERMEAYRDALQRVVGPSTVVVDIGAGAGIMTFLACKLGAKRVFAIEPNDAIHLAKEIAKANGLQNRIEFIQELSTRVELPETAQVIVSDLRGALPLFEQHLPSVIDARQRFLATGGVLIPTRDRLWATVVEVPELYTSMTGPWQSSRFGLDQSAGHQYVVNSFRRFSLKASEVVSDTKCWADLEYQNLSSPDLSGKADLEIQRSAAGHGIAIWFETELIEGVGFRSGPDKPDSPYESMFFAWEKEVLLDQGDRVSIDLTAKLIANEYVWSWRTRVTSAENREVIKAEFDQSTFYALPRQPLRLEDAAADHIPELSLEGEIDRFILEHMDGGLSLAEISKRVADRFPGEYASWETALDRVAELSQKYSK